MMEETGNFSSGCPGLYTRIFRIWAGSWSGAYTVYSIFQGPGRLLVRSVYKKLEKSGPGRNLYTQIFRAQVRFRVWSVYKILEKPGPGQNLYTQKFRAWASSWLLAYTESSKSQGPGQNLYTQIFRAWAGSWLLAYTNKLEKPGPRAESVYSNFQGQSRLSVDSVYRKLEEPGPGQNLYTQKFSARTGSWSGAYTRYSKKLALGRICILKFSGAGQVPDLGRIQKAREVRAQIDSCLLTYTAYSKSQDPGEPDSYHIEYTALALHYKHQSSAQTRKRKPIVSTRRV